MSEEAIRQIEEYLQVLEFGALIGDDSTMAVSEALPIVARNIRSIIRSCKEKANNNV